MAKKVEADRMRVWCVEPRFDVDGVQASSGIGEDGKEYPDPVPMGPPVGYSPEPDLMTMIRSMVRNEQFRAMAEAEGFETFEEADDFEIEDDPLDPLTEYEKMFYPADEAKTNGGPPAAAAPTVTPVPASPPPTGVAEGAEAGVSSPPPGSVTKAPGTVST